MRSVRRSRRPPRRPLLALIALVAALAVGYGVRAANSGGDERVASTTPSASATARPSGQSATNAPSAPSTSGGVALSSLPPQVAQTVALIKQGGPFPYPDNDGVVFHNLEGNLPHEPDGYYHEYTVPTPGSPDRGARRLVVGADSRYWYTSDHYDTFELVDLSR